MSQQEKEFEIIVNQFSKQLYRYAYWLSKDNGIAEDLVQETFLRAWKSFDSLKNVHAVKSWLYTIMRRENARRFEKKNAKLENSKVEYIEEEHQGDTLRNVFISEESSLNLHDTLGQLPKTYSEPLVLQVLGGYSCQEIATIMDLTPSNVMVRLHRAKKMLREILLEKEFQESYEKVVLASAA